MSTVLFEIGFRDLREGQDARREASFHQQAKYLHRRTADLFAYTRRW